MRHLFAACLVMVLASAVRAETEPPAPPAAGQVVLGTLPGIVVNTERREVVLEGRVCLQEGPLERVVCSEGTREHESVIAVKARPSHVTFALALLGLEPGTPGYVTEAGAFSPPSGQVLNITARFLPAQTANSREETETVEVPVWKLLALMGSDAAVEQPIDWVYVGRPEEIALQAADREGTVLCLSNFPEAVMDVPFESTDVNANLIYEANPKVVPPVGTPVELVIRPTQRRIEPQKVQVEVALRKGRPPTLDGKEMSPAEIKEAVNAMPITVRAAALKADADETFGRVMQMKDLLEDAMMQVRLLVLPPAEGEAAQPPPAAEAETPLLVTLTAGGEVRVGGQTLSLADFRAKAGDLIKPGARLMLEAEPTTPWQAVADVLAVARDHYAVVTIGRAEPPREAPETKP